MSDSASDPYGAFDPQEYLRQYYSTPALAGDDAAVFERLAAVLRGGARSFDSAIDVGCGPTVHHAFPLGPYVREIHLADYLPANLSAVRRWLAGGRDAHNWDPLLSHILRVEGGPEGRLEERKAEFRRKVTALKGCDLRKPDPLGDGSTYDLVTSFFTAECVAGSAAEWEGVMGNLLSLVRPGGTVFVAAIRNSRRYAVRDRWFPAAAVTEADFPPLLARHGFRPESLSVEAVAVPDWAAEGFDGIVIVSGTKKGEYIA